MVKPMLAWNKSFDICKVKLPCLVSFKFDGIRCLTEHGKLQSRSGKPIPNKFINEILGTYDLHGMDGELTVKGDFNTVQSAVMSVEGRPDFTYRVFDKHNVHAAFHSRVCMYKDEISSHSYAPRVKAVDQVFCYKHSDILEYYERALDEGHEGIIIKDPYGFYKHGRSTFNEGLMLKLKPREDCEGVIIECRELEHNCDTDCKKKANLYGGGVLGSFVLDYEGKEVKVGSGFSDKDRDLYWNMRDNLLGKKVCFSHFGLSAKGIPRQPIFKAIRLEE